MHILIADDHGVVRRGLKGILAEALPGADFSEAGSGDEVLNHLSKAKVALLVMDISMPGRSGMDVLRDVKHAYPQIAGHHPKLPSGRAVCRALSACRRGRLYQ
jgi:two-component system, NarL family, invasion response regulator UvrY